MTGHTPPTYGNKGTVGHTHGRKALVGISGGTHSAVTAAILKSQGLELQGVYFQVFDPKVPKEARFGSRCCLTRSVEQAQDVCRKLDIPLHVVDLEALFQDKVVDYFVHQLLQARLPNACVPCNLEIRFEALFEKARELGCELVATGHRAQVIQDALVPGKPPVARLLKAISPDRDQSYFLHGLGQAQLSRLMLPLGGFQDAMISRLAREFELPSPAEGNPREACFMSPAKHVPFVEARVAATLRPHGPIKGLDGSLLGEHHGLFSYQLGQEPKLAPQIKEKYQVVGFDLPNQSLLVGGPKDLFHSEARASGLSWVRPMDGLRPLKCSARYLSSQPGEVECRVTPFENATVRVEFAKPQPRLMAGQAIVFYEGEEVLGGAWIDHVGSPPRDEQQL